MREIFPKADSETSEVLKTSEVFGFPENIFYLFE
jgi:hypothetical protein